MSYPNRGQDLSLITEPNEGVAPILDAIRAARRSVVLTMYDLEDPQVEALLVAAEQRGVSVRALLNHGYYGDGERDNERAYAYLQAHRVPVRWAPAYFALTHQKTLVVDGRSAFIMTFNLTSQYYSSSRDFAVVDNNPTDVSAIMATFDADWQDRRITPSVGSGDLVWSPGSEPAELRLIDTAKPGSQIDIYNEEMDAPAIVSALASAARRRVQVRVTMTGSSAWTTAFAQLTAAGVHVRTYSPDASLYIHAKMILTTNAAFIGSENFSDGSMDQNRELGIIVFAPSMLDALRRTFNADFAAAQPFSST